MKIPDAPIWIDGKRAYAKSGGIGAVLGVSREMISRYTKAGMPYKEINRRMRLYDIPACIDWKVSRDVEAALKKAESDVPGEELDDDELNALQSEQLNRLIRIYQAKKLKNEAAIKELEHETMKGRYIKADDVDRAMAELAALLMSGLKILRDMASQTLSSEVVTQVQKTGCELQNETIVALESAIEKTLDEEIEKIVEELRNSVES